MLAAAGAILRFAVNVKSTGFNIHAVGVILMIAGVALVVISLMFWSTWGGFGRREIVETDRPRRTVIDDY
jgi:hypothetical protein